MVFTDVTDTFEVRKARINFSQYGNDIIIYPFGDVHWNSSLCDRTKFLAWCAAREREQKHTPVFYIGMGDYMDSLSFRERRCFISSALHESSLERIETAFKNDTKEFIEAIKFMKNRCLGIISGNHLFKFSSGITTDEMICEALKTQFLGLNCILHLCFERDIHHIHLIKIVIHHGIGRGIKKMQDLANNFNPDIFLMGHDHKRTVDFINRLDTTDARNGEPILINRRILLARTGSFLRGYVPGKASYINKTGLSPADLGTIRIIITPRRENPGGKIRKDIRWLDITAQI